MDIRRLKITQDKLRKPHQIERMVEFVNEGGIYNASNIAQHLGTEPHSELPLEIAKFPDGECYIHNGHHRAVSMFLAGRFFLEHDEYFIKEWDYSDYDDIVFLNPDGTWRGYVTPFDVRNECRLPNFKKYKKKVKSLYWEQSPMHAVHYILTHPELYKTNKTNFSVEDLAHYYEILKGIVDKIGMKVSVAS